MGKFPPSMRSARLPIGTILKKSPSQSPSPAQKPYYLAGKVPNKKPKQSLPQIAPLLPTITFDSPSLSDAKTVFNKLISSPKKPPLDLRFCNAILQSFSTVGTLQDSICFLNHMVKTHPTFSPDSSTFNILLVQCCKAADYSISSVHQVLNYMSNQGYPPNKVTTDVAVRTLCSAGREEDAIEVIKDLSGKNLLPDSHTYNCLVRHLVKNRDLSTVNSFIQEMKKDFEVKPDLVTYTIMIDNVCNRKNLREATRLLKLLSAEGYKPDSYVYNTIMKGYCMLHQSGEVLDVYKKMKEEGVEPDLVTYNTLIYGLSKSGRIKEAKKFLGIMTEMGHFPDAVTYTSLMNGMCRARDELGALALLEEMEAKGCSPNSCTYNTLLYGLSKSRLVDKGIELYKSMQEGGIKLETGSYGAFIRALCKDGRVAEAYEIFDYALESKSMTDVCAYTTLESNLKWLKKAREQGLIV
ncbi:OLC1v1011159C1 [Oldenlandia corymbosa var. corymbosa]|uniref:OLC1v1011159C1 n=1 Tax=Oldenlandia corymbosa var. corymbosa TaxID=529605 RepID=A0AAV1DT24_OLDCO|nr:OLC1v1011159C1 [Oldenlandia corymbosa var. corymbosa]